MQRSISKQMVRKRCILHRILPTFLASLTMHKLVEAEATHLSSRSVLGSCKRFRNLLTITLKAENLIIRPDSRASFEDGRLWLFGTLCIDLCLNFEYSFRSLSR
ncbi:hypothetical protein HDK77DRAFT_67534 [Phyllosticta capitalensis]|uniref:Secreted protein n=1 Tax=Phyllosticta capitalensis TaxID=121624 RepID=A0ABR1YQP3_9PEZI